MQKYQREVVALIRASGARLSVLHDHRLVELWREYSQRTYCCGWIDGDRPEVYRFVTWSNGLRGIGREIILAQKESVRGYRGIHVRSHAVRAWGGWPMVEKRLG